MGFSMDLVIIIVSIISLLVIGCLAYFGFILDRRRFPYQFPHEFLHDWVRTYKRPPDPNLIQSIWEEYLSRRNEFWTLYGQFMISVFVVLCITILLLTKVISAEAGLPILAGVGGFAIGKGVTIGRAAYRMPERPE